MKKQGEAAVHKAESDKDVKVAKLMTLKHTLQPLNDSWLCTR